MADNVQIVAAMQNKKCCVDNSIYAVNSFCHTIAILHMIAGGVQKAVVVQVTEVVHIEVSAKLGSEMFR